MQSTGRSWTSLSEETKHRIEHWYGQLFARLARRLLYGGNKARNAPKRLTLHWGSQGVPEALAWGPVNAMSVVQKIGAQAGLITRRTLEKYLREAGNAYGALPL